MRTYLFFCIVFVLLTSCSKPKENNSINIDINKGINSNTAFNNYFKNLDFIALETNDKCLIKSIAR